MQYFTEEDIREVLQGVIDNFLLPRFLSLKMEASGEWRDSLEIQPFAAENKGVIRGRFYSYWLAKGRQPNADQDPKALRAWAVWAGSTFIKKWVQDKGLAADPIAVAYNIAKNGTKAKGKGSNLLEVFEEPECRKYVEDRMRAILTARVADELRRSAANALR